MSDVPYVTPKQLELAAHHLRCDHRDAEAAVVLRAAEEIIHLRKLVAQGYAVVEDFMPNVGRCVLQDYGRMNEFLVDAGKIKRAQS